MLAILTTGILMTPATVAAFGPFSDVCSNGDASGSALCNSTSKSDSKGNPLNPLTGGKGLLGAITEIIAFIAGAAAIILIVVGALRFVTAGGDSNKAASARKTVVNALIGLAVIVIGKVLIDFVLSKL